MKYAKWITLSISLLIILSCGDDEDNIAHNVTASAYFRGMMIDGKAKYAPVLVAESSDTCHFDSH